MRRIYLFIVLFLFISIQLSAQRVKVCKEFRKLSRPEKCWVIKHPFIAKKAFLLTQSVRKATDSLKNTTILDGDANGGQVDAFRHSYWMALLSHKFNWRKAYHLGKAHEKGNYIDYKKQKYEEGSIPDKISSDMDICNNLTGIEISFKFKGYNLKFKEVKDSLQKVILKSILDGKMTIIKKDSKGRFLDEKGNIIDNDSIKHKWINNKCLVPSNFYRL